MEITELQARWDRVRSSWGLKGWQGAATPLEAVISMTWLTPSAQGRQRRWAELDAWAA